MLGVATLDFIDHLRSLTNGWRIEPVIPLLTINDYMQSMHPLVNQSPTDFFIDHMTNFYTNRMCYIKIKIHQKSLRFIKCEIEGHNLILSYWSGEGWKQTCRSISKSYHRCPDFIYDSGTVFRLYKIIRITKGRRNRGRKDHGSETIIHIDKIALGDPCSANQIARKAISTIMKSYINNLSARILVLNNE